MSRRRAAKYLQLEAESGSEEYESEESSEDLDNLAPVLPPSKVKSFSQFTEELEQRYKHEQDYEREVEDVSEEGVLEIQPQSSLLPTITSPLLFLIRCKVGKERDIVMKLYENIKEKEICSVIYKEGLKGYIYIEAYSKQKVEELLHTVNNVSRRKFSVVPFKEMVEAISYKKSIVVGDFARIKGGKYRGDLVQILENYEENVKVKLVPRLENTKKLFDPNEHHNETVAKDGGFYYNRDFYRNGYLEKIMLKTNLDFEVEPTFGELEELNLKGSISINDPIRIARGDLKNMTGTVESIVGNIAIISSGNKRYEVNMNELEKNFSVGQEVSYKGENGVILAIENGKAVLGVDEFTREVEVALSDLNLPVAEKRVPQIVPYRIRSKRDPLVNKQVRIVNGQYKGLTGTVKDVIQEKCIVQLRSNHKQVTIDRRSVFDEKGYEAPVPRPVEQFEAIGNKTPSFKTPSFKTPAYRTPTWKTPSFKTPATENTRYSNTYANEEAGADWLVSPYYGAEIRVNNKNYILSDFTGGSYKTTTDEMFFPHEIGYSMPSIYDRVVILDGPDKGVQGTVISITGHDCKVRDKDENVFFAKVDMLTKKVE